MTNQGASRFCPHCGAARSPGAAFCPTCGTRFDSATASRQRPAGAPWASRFWITPGSLAWFVILGIVLFVAFGGVAFLQQLAAR